MSAVERAYELAKSRYGQLGIDTDDAMKKLANIKNSLQCWQGDFCGKIRCLQFEIINLLIRLVRKLSKNLPFLPKTLPFDKIGKPIYGFPNKSIIYH